MNKIKIEGIVERYAPSLVGHGDHGFSVLLIDRETIYHFQGVREAYSPDIGRPSIASSTLVELMAVGDHISFEVDGDSKRDFLKIAISQTMRNWTLEQRLIGSLKDVTPQASLLSVCAKQLT